MDVQTERYLEPLDRVEVLAGPTGRRKWPDHVKGQLVAESFLPGVRLPSVMGLSPIICQRGAGWQREVHWWFLIWSVQISQPLFWMTHPWQQLV